MIYTLKKREKKAFLNDQCKDIEENSRMGKTKDIFKKIRDPEGTCHLNMGSVKDRNIMDLMEAEWQWYPTPVLFPEKSHGQRSLKGSLRVGHD